MLGAFCLFLSTIEYLIPKPMPFMRLGIANLPLLLALDLLPFGDFMLLALIKTVGQGMVTGTLFSYILLFSLAGTLVSALSMFALRRLLGPERVGMAGVSVLGALLSNGAQLALARVFVFGPSVRYIAPPFLAAGVITGTVLGLLCERFIRTSRWHARETGILLPLGDEAAKKTTKTKKTTKSLWFSSRKDTKEYKRREKREDSASPVSPAFPFASFVVKFSSSAVTLLHRMEEFRLRRREVYERIFGSRDLCLAGVLMMVALVFNPNPYLRVPQFLFFVLLLWLAGKKNNALVTIAVILSIVGFNLLAPYGRVLFSVGVFRLTEGALRAGLQRAVTLEGLIMLSRFAIRRDLRLPGSFGVLIGESFRILALIQERRNTVSAKNFIADIDALMLELSDTENGAAPASTATLRRTSSPAGRVFLAAAVLLSWLPWAFL
jgi:heptaprenyl diphosphate synthase